MQADIVERLRDYSANGSRPWLGIEAVFTEAANEIASLRARVAELEDVLADATEHLGLVLGSDPGPKEQACRQAALKWWLAYDAEQERAHLLTLESDNG